MKKSVSPVVVTTLLSFNAGFVDAASFLGLDGLFTAHVTGNFVTLAAALVAGSHGILGKLLALPEFILVIALARFAGAMLRKRKAPVLRIFLVTEVVLLLTFFALAVGCGPFPNTDTPAALATAFAGVAAMALQNGFQRVHFASAPPTTIMTGNTTQATIDAVDLLMGASSTPETRARFKRVALGCALSALLYWAVGFWCLGVAVLVGVVTALLRVES